MIKFKQQNENFSKMDPNSLYLMYTAMVYKMYELVKVKKSIEIKTKLLT